MINFITNLLNIDRTQIKSFNIASLPDETRIHITLHSKKEPCPFCGGVVHSNGYSSPIKINHPILQDRKMTILFRNQRFKCNECLRTFSATNPFTFPTFRNTYFTLINVMKQIANLNLTYSMIVQNNHLSVTQVQRYCDSFLTIPSDAYYLLKTWHDLIEKDVFLDNKPVYNERFKRKLNKRQLQEMILDLNENLTLGYRLKEMYLYFNSKATSKDCEEWFDSIYEAFLEADLPEYREFINMLSNWRTEILNSFIRPYNEHKLSNALTENMNGRIKAYLHISKGVSNFKRFRKRMIFALNPSVFYTITDQLKSESIPRNNKNE